MGMTTRALAALDRFDPWPSATVALDVVAANPTGRPFYKALGSVQPQLSLLPNLTVSRATPAVAYAVDAGGTLIPFAPNMPRATSKGLLIEGPATNLLIRSQQIGTSSGWNIQTLIANAVAAPDGTVTASQFTTAATATQSTTLTNGTVYTATYYAKPGTLGFAAIDCFDGLNDYGAVFSLSTGQMTATRNANPLTAQTETLANGWYRIGITFTSTGTGSGAFGFQVSGATGPAWANAGTGAVGTLNVWGAQLEAGSRPTSYIPTLAVSVARAAEIILLAYAPTAPFTIVASAISGQIGTTSDFRQLFTFDDGTSLNAVAAYQYDGAPNITAFVNTANVTVASSSVAIVSGGLTGVAIRVQTSNFGTSFKGQAAVDVVTGAAPSPTILRLGSDTAGSSFFNGYLAQLRIYPYAATDAELVARSGGN